MEQDSCEYCNATLPDDEKLVTVYRHRRGQHFIFERVPARVCQRCGERYFAAYAVAEMGRLMRRAKPATNLVPVRCQHDEIGGRDRFSEDFGCEKRSQWFVRGLGGKR